MERGMADVQFDIVDDPAALAAAAARAILKRALAATQAQGRFTIALSGGSTPRAIYQQLAQPELSAQMPWAQTYVFWSDERAVPLDDQRSNYRMASEALLHHVPLPKENIKPMLGQADLAAAAQHYERVIRGVVPGEPPRFDLVLLGMGPDGHTASLFPHSPQLSVTDALVTATPPAPLEPHVERLTFTSTLINAAAEVLFIVAGADKAGRLHEVIEGPRQPEALPSQLVQPMSGTLRWMLDRAAAQQLAVGHG
jgi:6-phosphogluconolactonase